MLVGIEGPAGAGKSTMAHTVAAERGAVVIEGGAWYRALTYRVLTHGVALDDTERIKELANHLDLSLKSDSQAGTRFILDNVDVTDSLHSEEVERSVPIVSQQLEVRELIVQKFINAVRSQVGAIIVGRHLKRAFPEVPILYLTIDSSEADRRHKHRGGDTSGSVANRNEQDAVTAKKLKMVTTRDEIDVTSLTQDEQAEVLRNFIDSH